VPRVYDILSAPDQATCVDQLGLASRHQDDGPSLPQSPDERPLCDLITGQVLPMMTYAQELHYMHFIRRPEEDSPCNSLM
jgi:hypothetical protein